MVAFVPDKVRSEVTLNSRTQCFVCVVYAIPVLYQVPVRILTLELGSLELGSDFTFFEIFEENYFFIVWNLFLDHFIFFPLRIRHFLSSIFRSP